MAEFLSAEQLLGSGQPPEKAKTPAGPAWVSAEELTGQPTERTFLDAVKGFLGEKAAETGAALKSVGEFAGAGIGMAAGAVAGSARALEGMAKGKPRREALQEGIETSGRVGAALNPMTVATKLLGYAPDPTVIEHVMEKMAKAIHHYGEKVEVGTDRAILAEDVDLFSQLLMGAGMGKATVKGIEAGTKAATAPAKPGLSMEDMAPPKPAEPAADAPVQSVGELLVMEKSKQVKELFKKAKAKGAPMPLDVTPEALENLFNQAREGTLPERGAPKTPLTPEQAVEQSKTRIAEGLTLEEARAKLDAEDAPPTDLALAIEKVRGGRAFDLTAEEKISLDNSLKVKSGVLLDHNGRPFERGSVDPDLLKGILAAGGVAAFVAMNPDKAEEVAWISGGALAIKGKGGNWHPDTVRQLAEPMYKALGIQGVERLDPATFDGMPSRAVAEFKQKFAFADQADRMVSSYLNKHAGTATDPLKDVRLSDGTRWEDVTDKALRAKPMGQYRPDSAPVDHWGFRIPNDAPVWNLHSNRWVEGFHEAEALKSYLSHVGDFLRMNVKPEDLAKYDLVRAVKESAANDARVAKEMERVAAASTKDLPVYKDYGDGMKWVELKLPETLTEEQARGVRPGTNSELRRILREDDLQAPVPVLNTKMEGYLALDVEGKPIRNNYTGSTAAGKTPAEAYLAGKLAEEGNCMGHCVGGYVDDVASGATRILSLRDKKGQSHVTVEVDMPKLAERDAYTWARDYPDINKALDAEFGNDKAAKTAAWKERYKPKANIAQIKGKQNKAPVDAYQPYVQDLVRSGAWGEVRDLQNTGLLKHPKTGELLSYEEARVRAKSVQEFMWPDGNMYEGHPNGRGVDVREQLKGEQSVANERAVLDLLSFEGKAQRGSADPELLAKVAAGVAAGAYLASSDVDPELAAAALGLGLTMKGKPEAALLDHLRKGGKEAELAATELYTRTHKQVERTLRAQPWAKHVSIEEAVNDGMYSAIKSAADGSFRGDSKFSTYATTAVLNRGKNQIRDSLDQMKDVSIHEQAADGTDFAETLGHQDTPEKAALNKVLGERINAALEKIDPRFKDSFLAVEAEGLSYEEAAARFGVPVGTIRSRVSRAKTDMQAVLRDYRDGATGATEVPQNSATMRAAERGSASTETLAGIAAVGSGAALAAYLNPDNRLGAALVGGMLGAGATRIRPREIAAAIERASSKIPMIHIDDMTRSTVYARRVAEREAFQLGSRIESAVPEQARREAIFRWLDGNKKIELSPAETRVATEVRDFFEALGEKAKGTKVIREMLDNYATRIYGPDSRSLLHGKTVGGDASMNSPFGKHRAFPTLEEAMAAGHIPVTLDIAKVVEAYSNSITSAIENRKFVKVLKEAQTDAGDALIAKEGKAPREYVFVDHPQLRGLRVHPDIAGDLRFIFDSTQVGPILRTLDAINTTQKRMAVSFSLFHIAALEHAMLGATSLLKSPARGVRVLAQSLAPKIFGESLALKMVREGGVGDGVDAAMKAGLQFGFERGSPALEELRSGFYETMKSTSDFLDKTVPQLGTQTVGRFVQINHLFDKIMWGRFHATMKLETFLDKSSELSRNNARAVALGKAALKPVEQINREAASFTNDAFGGLDWQGMTREMQNRWSRELATAAYSPTGRMGMRMVLFAPDWTISTTRAFLKAFGHEGAIVGGGAILGAQLAPDNKTVGALLGGVAGLGAGRAMGLKGTGGSGLRGLVQPAELADLHRQYILRSALIYTVVVDALNVQMSGHHIWDNKDPTRLDRGDGTTQQVSKHFMEPIHWLLTPRQQAMNKLSFVVKEPLAQMQDVEYLSATGAPKMGAKPLRPDMTLEEMRAASAPGVRPAARLAHVAKSFSPIAAQQSFEAGDTGRAAAGFFGAPIYGHTKVEKAEAKAQLQKLRQTPAYKQLQAERKRQKAAGK